MKFGHIKKKSAYILLVCLAFSIESVLRYVEQIFARLPIVGDLYPFLTPSIFVILIIISRDYLFRIKSKDLIFYMIFFQALFVSYVLFPANRVFIEDNFPGLVFSMLPFFILGRTMDVSDDVKDALFKISEMAIVIAWVYVVYYYSSGRALGSDAMYESYTLIVHTLIMMWAAFEKPNPIRIMFVLAGIMYALSMGTRGPIVIIVAFFGLLLFKKSQTNLKWKFFLISIVVILALVLSNQSMMHEIILYLKQVVGGWGLSTRIFDDYLFDIAKDSLNERRMIYDTLIRLFKENPLGYGLYGEYSFIGWSAHNIYLQICFEFGIFFGLMFMVFFLVTAIKSISGNYSSNNVIFIWLWLCYIIPQGFFGGNLISFYMFFTIGLMLGQIDQIKRRQHIKGDHP